MPYREGDPTEVFEGVVVIDRRDEEKQRKSILCRFADGKERFVSRSQVPQDFEWPENDVEFDLEVSTWMADTWAAEPPPRYYVISDVVVMRAIDGKYGPAIRVRFSDGREEWVSKKHIMPGSPVQDDGDRGDLWIGEWLANSDKMRGVQMETPGNAPQGVGSLPTKATNVGDDARNVKPEDGDNDPVDGLDDIPF